MFAVMKTFVTDISASTVLWCLRNKESWILEEMILYLICGFGMVTSTVSPLSRFTAHLLPVYRVT
jgi:hypothetical protein